RRPTSTWSARSIRVRRRLSQPQDRRRRRVIARRPAHGADILAGAAADGPTIRGSRRGALRRSCLPPAGARPPPGPTSRRGLPPAGAGPLRRALPSPQPPRNFARGRGAAPCFTGTPPGGQRGSLMPPPGEIGECLTMIEAYGRTRRVPFAAEEAHDF